MSFMFHPYPYVDPNAVNPINAPESVKKGLVKGPQAVAKEIARQIKAGKTRVGIDCYAAPRLVDLMTGDVYQVPETLVKRDDLGEIVELVNLPLTDSPLLLMFGDFDD